MSLLALSSLCVCGARVKSVRWDNPSLLLSNQDCLGVHAVTLSDTATEVQVLVRQHQGKYCFTPKTYLLADDGQRYPIRYQKGLPLGQMLDAGRGDTVVSLVFAPVPRSTQSIDLIEGPDSYDFRLLGISSGKQPLQVKPRTIDETQFDALRRDFFHSATATLKGRIEGYNPKGSRHALTVYYDNVLTNVSQPLSIDIDDDGSFSQQIDLDYPILYSAFCKEIGITFYFHLKPGQILDVTLHRDGSTEVRDLSGHGYEFAKLMDFYPRDLIAKALPSAQTEARSTSVPEFQQRMQARAALCDSVINYMAPRLGYNDFDYKYAMMISHIEVAMRFMSFFVYARNYSKQRPYQDDSLRILTDTYRPLTRWIDNDVLQLSISEFSHLQNRFSFAGFMFQFENSFNHNKYSIDSARHAEDARLYGAASPSLLHQVDILNRIYRNYGRNVRIVNKDNLAEQKAIADLERIFNSRKTLLSHPFFVEKANQVFRHYIEQTDLAYDLPEGEATQIFRRITDRYKGKYLYIDFWATTCGPCVAAIRNSLKMRQDLHDNPDVKFIFITGDRESPQKAYDQFVAQYLADEDVYRIPQMEIVKLKNLFQFNGIPHYEALDREGRVLRDFNSYRDFNTFELFYERVLDPLRIAYGEATAAQLKQEHEAAEALKHANDSLYVVRWIGKDSETGKDIDTTYILQDKAVPYIARQKEYRGRTTFQCDDPKRPFSDNPRSKKGVVMFLLEEEKKK